MDCWNKTNKKKKKSEFFSDVKDCDGKKHSESEWRKSVMLTWKIKEKNSGKPAIPWDRNIFNFRYWRYNNKQTLSHWKMGDNLANLEPQMLQLNPPSPCACSYAMEELRLFYWWLYCTVSIYLSKPFTAEFCGPGVLWLGVNVNLKCFSSLKKQQLRELRTKNDWWNERNSDALYSSHHWAWRALHWRGNMKKGNEGRKRDRESGAATQWINK